MFGVLMLNLLFMVTGLALLAGLRGWSTWIDLLDSLGLALVLGICSVGVLGTLVLIAGSGLPLTMILALAAGVSAVGVTLAVVLRRPLPRRLGPLPSLSLGTCAACIGAVAAGSILVGLFRLARVMPLSGGDSFEFWVPKAKVIYFFGKIDTPLFTGLTSPRYPLFVPTLQAMDFRFMGSAFGPELAVQYWFLYAGFIFAAFSLMRRLAPAWLAWLFLALTSVLPQLVGRVLNSQADWALDLPFALSALLALVWLRERERWQLISLSVLLAAVIATKQEGLLLVGCLYAGLAAASWRDRRRAWPPLAIAGAAAYLVNLPWRIWWGERHLPATLPTVGVGDLLTHLHRGWVSLHLVLRLIFNYDMWFALLPIALIAAVAAFTLGGKARETAVLYLVTAIAAVAGFTYILWDDFTYRLDEQQSSTPMPRAVGSIMLLSTVFAPLLIAPLLRRTAPPDRSPSVTEAA
jgi:hypothetical protein